MPKTRLCEITLCILAASLLVGCGVQASPERNDRILLQLAWSGDPLDGPLGYSMGRAPEFTLMADGRVFYYTWADEYTFAPGQVMVAHLTQAEKRDVVQRVLDLGFERLESYTSSCMKTPSGETCITDAGYSTLRLRLKDDSVREVVNTAGFANDPEALSAIRALLQEYEHPEAELYSPEKAALSVERIRRWGDRPTRDWPLDPAWLVDADPGPCYMILSGHDLEALLTVADGNAGYLLLGAEGRVYVASLVPWLPGEDHTGRLAQAKGGRACSPP